MAGRFGFAESIAVNLPNRLFERVDLVEHIHQAVTRSGVPHHAIEIEITETGLMKRDSGNVHMTLHRLNEMGVEISIDDFGTGYSSLAYLTNMPIQRAQDRPLVRPRAGSRAQEFGHRHRDRRARAFARAARRGRRGRDAAPDGKCCTASAAA